MSLINVSNLTFYYEGSHDNIFEDVSFQIDTDWKLGFIGRNGRGKTTFLNLLRGKHEYRGKISSIVNFDYFPFEIENKSKDTIQIIEQINTNCQRWKIIKELTLLEVSEEVLDRSFDSLSFGEQTKVMLATLFTKENNFLLIDEPTNHLDTHGRYVVSEYLNSKKGFILVSHDRTFLDGCIDHVLSINKSKIEVQKGNYSSWQKNKDMQDSYELLENSKLKKDIKRLNEAAKQTSTWSDKVEKTKFGTLDSGLKPDRGRIGHKAAKMMKRSKITERRQLNASKDKSKLLKDMEISDKLLINCIKYHSKRLVEIYDLSLFYDCKCICKNIDFTINQGERVAITGKNGSGKSSILKLIVGEKIDYKGNLEIASNLKISYVSQDTSFLKGNLRKFSYDNDIDESQFKTILRKLGFSREQFEKDMSDFSGGQKKKVLLAKSLCENAHLYIWDEPFNFIDVISRIQIEELLLEHKPTMIFVEHDKAFAEKIATKYVEL